MNKNSKALMLKYAEIGLNHAPKNADPDELERVRQLIKWTAAGATGDWSAVKKPKKAPAIAEANGLPVKPVRAKRGKKATPAMPDHEFAVVGVEIDD